MGYVNAFRAIFAYVAHLTASANDPDQPAIDAQAVKSDLSLLLGDAVRHRNEPLDPNFDQAWFALTAWLDFTLGQIPNGDAIASALIEPVENRDADFFRRLGLLLTPLPNGYPKEILSIIEVYSTCLELDRPEAHRDPDRGALVLTYRQRCRQALAAPPPAKAERKKEGGRFGGPALAVAVWIAPVVVPLFLYGLYKYILGNLYANVVG